MNCVEHSIADEQKMQEQGRKCAICHEEFTDYSDVVPEHKDPKGMGGLLFAFD